MSDEREKQDAVGYKNPPRHTRFKPGRSGNPAGRPPKTRSSARILREILDERIPVTLAGKRVRRSRLELIFRVAMKKAMAGDLRAWRNFMRWAHFCGLLTTDPAPAEEKNHGVMTFSEYEARFGPLDD